VRYVPEVSDAIDVFSAHAPDYDATRRAIVPCWDAFYGTAVELVSRRGGPVERVLDIGAGTGFMSEAVLAAHPSAHVVLLDGSEEMLAHAAERLPQVEIVQGDMREGLPAGPFDAVVSSLAIHHLEHDEQRALYAAAAERLRPGGVFVNAEHILERTPWLEKVGRARWRAAAGAAGASEAELDASDGRMEFNRCATVAQCLGWLEEAGMEDCECFFQQFYFAVLAGWRPA
jgi:tRNA (cmo5U34)-methyltransferase